MSNVESQMTNEARKPKTEWAVMSNVESQMTNEARKPKTELLTDGRFVL
jgi:hypothetical protein